MDRNKPVGIRSRVSVDVQERIPADAIAAPLIASQFSNRANRRFGPREIR